MFDADKLGKDKSLGKVTIDQADLDSGEPRWFPLQGVKSGEILLSSDILAAGQSPTRFTGVGSPIKGKLLNKLLCLSLNHKY